MSEAPNPTVVALVKDLFFSVKLSNEIRAAGFVPRMVKSTETFSEGVTSAGVALGVIDLGGHIDRETLAQLSTTAQSAGVPVIAFGPHKDVDALRDAQAAGMTRVLSNGVFHAQTAEMIRRYARTEPGDQTSA